MAFQMRVESLEFKKVPPGIYEVKFLGFKPKWSKNKDSVNFNPSYEVINSPEHDGTKVFDSINSKAGFLQAEMCHCFGLNMEDAGNGSFVIPGIWDGDAAAFKEDDPTTWKYEGPLTGRTGKIEVGLSTYEGKEQSKVRQYIWAISGAEITDGLTDDKHIKDLLAKK